MNNFWRDENLVKILKENGVVVMPTDTLYGVVGKALDVSVVDRIYNVRKRNPEKPCIILIGDINELQKFGIDLTSEQKVEIEKFTRPTSFVLDCPAERFAYLHRGTKTLAFRLPAEPDLRELLLKTGPLVAPSANLEARPPSETIAEAKNYFGNQVDLYVEGGIIEAQASKVIRLRPDGAIEVLRL